MNPAGHMKPDVNNHAGGSGGGAPISWHRGPVMSGGINVYYIWYVLLHLRLAHRFSQPTAYNICHIRLTVAEGSRCAVPTTIGTLHAFASQGGNLVRH